LEYRRKIGLILKKTETEKEFEGNIRAAVQKGNGR